jgi:4,4'-diaponeurosporenoate glycosyltransferase
MTTAALLLGVLLGVQQALFWLPGFFLLWRIPRICGQGGRAARHPGTDRPSGRISVIIPARNEARTLPYLLASLAAQKRKADEIIVVDDGSEDATAEVAARLGARVVAAGPKPDDWMGKPWACWLGAQVASGDLFAFLDADTTLAPGGLSGLADARAADGGLVGVQPYHTIRRPYEALSAFFNIVALAGPNAFSMRGRTAPPSGSFGACMACSRADYFAAGGHAAVRAAIVEDMAVGRRFQEVGLPVTCYGGRGAVSFRMYPDGIASLVEGFTKNMAIGASEMHGGFRTLIILWLTGVTVCVISSLAALLPWFAIYRPMQAAFYALYAGQLYWMLRRIGSFGLLTALAFPVPLAFFHAVFFRSMHLVRRGNEVTWKGRSIRTRGRNASRGA